MIRSNLVARGRLVIVDRHAQAGIHGAGEPQRSHETTPLVTEQAV